MKPYKFTSKAQDESKIKEIKKLKEEKESMKGKKLLKEATFSVTTVEDAIDTIQDCMMLIAQKKSNINMFVDLISSSIISGVDDIALAKLGPDDGDQLDKFSTIVRKKIIMAIRNSLTL